MQSNDAFDAAAQGLSLVAELMSYKYEYTCSLDELGSYMTTLYETS
jgi:hypothetical protein